MAEVTKTAHTRTINGVELEVASYREVTYWNGEGPAKHYFELKNAELPEEFEGEARHYHTWILNNGGKLTGWTLPMK